VEAMKRISAGKVERMAIQKGILLVSGIVVEGHRVASGPSKEYPYGSLERQKPFFKAQGLDLDRFFPGTLNVSIAPLLFEMVRPAYTFRQIAWTNLHPPEDFSFSPCRVNYQSKEYEGYIYYPHPETKIRHFQNSSLIEVITEEIPGVGYGTQLELALDPAMIRIYAE
jgi:hypothetical protein